jgi:hypothetical protein
MKTKFKLGESVRVRKQIPIINHGQQSFLGRNANLKVFSEKLVENYLVVVEYNDILIEILESNLELR